MGRYVFDHWVTLIAGVFMMTISGTIYLYPSYKSAFATQLGLTESQANEVATFINIGSWAGVIGGACYDSFGPRLTGFVGSAMLFAGYFMLYAASAKLVHLSPLLLAFMGLLGGQGSSWTYSVALNTNSINFHPDDRGKVVGFLVAFFGLCAGVFSQIYNAYFEDDITTFLLFLSITPTAVAILATVLSTKREPEAAGNSDRRLKVAYVQAVLLAGYLAAASIIEALVDDPPRKVFTLVLLGFLATYWLYAIYGRGKLIEWEAGNGYRKDSLADPINNSHPSATAKTSLLEPEPVYISETPKVLSPQLNLQRAMMTMEFWLLFFIFFAGIGAGITVLDNLANIVTSRSPADKDTSTTSGSLVALFSAFNTWGRMISGYLSDKYSSHRFPRAAFLAIALFMMTGTVFLFVFATPTVMYIAVPLLGIAYGSVFCLTPALTSEFFGLANFGANWGLLGLAPGVGSELFNTIMASKFYNKYAYEPVGGGKKVCTEWRCYRMTILILTGVSAFGFLLSLALAWRRRRIESRLHSHKIHSSEQF